MALAILTGSLTATDFALGGTSIKCVLAQINFEIVAGGTSQTTFCSGGAVEETKGMVQLIGSVLGFLSKGTTYSEFGMWVLDPDPVAMVITADTSCTITADVNVFSESGTINAAANTGRGVGFRSNGDITVAWATE